MENVIDELSDDVFLQNSPDDLIETISQGSDDKYNLTKFETKYSFEL
jgi:hypothetical protein